MSVRFYKKLIFIILFIACVIVGIYQFTHMIQNNNKDKDNKTIRIGVAIYRGDDTFISTMMGDLDDYAKMIEQEKGIKIKIDIADANENQSIQNDQINKFISLKYDVLCVNMVDRTEASTIIDKAMEANIPIVFFNREPVEEDMNRWEKMYYVGSDAKKQAVLQGELVIDAYKADPGSIDINGDGTIQYVMLEGEIRHQDSMVRTEWSVLTLKNSGLELEKLVGGIANWERTQASALMETWHKLYGDQIELIICNNDDMALGVVDALDRANYSFHNIVGIDGTPQGINAVKEGKILGTVMSDTTLHAKAIFDIAYALTTGGDVSEVVTLEDNKYVRIEQKKLTLKEVE
ncbi:galactose ABC transporter substrate-binding protein [Clostridium sp. Marseille-P299]|uniref:galactose ABC transporter substrate-binding protein n=1 Tax=Clostridium sp. Marseille-P299 TaxID=1805477 RepID=UPI00083400ED|nr:galactose ABC transporter substrate-binding protein [Clostridium sp. Marseille-P299]